MQNSACCRKRRRGGGPIPYLWVLFLDACSVHPSGMGQNLEACPTLASCWDVSFYTFGRTISRTQTADSRFAVPLV